MRILVTGAMGQLGWELTRALRPCGEVVSAARRVHAPDVLPVDLSSPDSLRNLIRKVRPQLIVNAAAYTAVDKAEEEKELASAVNGVAPGILAEEAKALNAALIHYSTDYVFDGRETEPYKEDDRPNPVNVYGRTKLEGERAVAAIDAAHLTLRTSWVYGTRGKNFLLTLRRLARERDAVSVVDDQIGAPTWSRLIASATMRIVIQAKGDVSGYINERRGLYHMTCAGRTSWFGFAKEIIASLEAEGGGRVAEVIPITTADYPQAAQRPAWSVLDNRRLAQTFNIQLADWRETAQSVLKELGRPG